MQLIHGGICCQDNTKLVSTCHVVEKCDAMKMPFITTLRTRYGRCHSVGSKHPVQIIHIGYGQYTDRRTTMKVDNHESDKYCHRNLVVSFARQIESGTVQGTTRTVPKIRIVR